MNALPSTVTLKNGLTCVLAPIKGLQSVTVLLLVKAGTRYETPVNNGISHFLEHMVFKGTKKYKTAMDISTTVDGIGGAMNAFTDKEYTGFYVKAAASEAEVAFDVVSQMVFQPTLPKSELEIERGVILEEIRMYEDQPPNKILREYFNLLYPKSTLGWDTLGKSDIIRKLSQQDFLDYYRYMYTPNRMVLVIAGGVDKVRDLDTLLASYFDVSHGTTEFTHTNYEFVQKKPQFRKVVKDTEQCHLVYGFRSFGRGNKDRYVMAVMSALLGGGMSSRLFTEIREKRGLAYYVSSWADTFAETGYFLMRAGTKPESAQEVIDLAKTEFSKLQDKKIPAKELKKAQQYLKGHLLLGFEDSSEVANFFGEDLLLEGKMRSVKEVVEGIDQVSVQDVQRLATNLFVPQSENVAVIGPEKHINNLEI